MLIINALFKKTLIEDRLLDKTFKSESDDTKLKQASDQISFRVKGDKKNVTIHRV